MRIKYKVLNSVSAWWYKNQRENEDGLIMLFALLLVALGWGLKCLLG